MKQILLLTFYKKIQLSLIIFILIPLTFAFILSYYLVQKSVIEKVENSRQNLVDIIAADINKNIEDIIYSSNLFGNPGSSIYEDLQKFSDVTEIATFEDYARYIRIADFLNLSFAKTSSLDTYVFFTNNQGLFINGGFNNKHTETLKTIVDLEQIHTLNPNQQYWKGTYHLDLPSSLEPQPLYFSVRTFKDFTTGRNLGTIFAGIPNSYFEQLFSIDDHNELILYNADSEVIYKTPQKSEKIIGSIFEISSTVPHTDWKVVYRSSSEEITGEIKTMVGFYLFVLLGGFSIFMTISIFISRSIYKPLNILQKTAEEFGDHNLQVRFPDKGNDEIALLGMTFNKMLDQINLLIHKVKQEEELKRQYELKALFAQIRPHFLMNTLNSIKCNLLLNDDDIHSRQVDSLMRLLRAYMKVDEEIPIRQECDLLLSYIEIMEMRNDLDLKLVINIPEKLERMFVPRLILQPIVENSILHGFNEDILNPQIRVNVYSIDEFVNIEIVDNGIGMTEDKMKRLITSLHEENVKLDHEDHIGMKNIYNRLILTFGKKVSLYVHPNENSGVSVRLSIPIEEIKYQSESNQW
ncbi:sensor histidine kinase [Alkalihalobacillus sp. 1P02AB]|uniref:sensor histidine kinase n=1 Tax=Alkalihalobacillus sp. 1P02AB TaxID=3132260 RepID=UPI0039A67364